MKGSTNGIKIQERSPSNKSKISEKSLKGDIAQELKKRIMKARLSGNAEEEQEAISLGIRTGIKQTAFMPRK